MEHGASFIAVDQTELQQAITNNASKDHISFLKQKISWEAVYGFEYATTTFPNLATLLCNDYGFSPFKYASVEEGAIYNKEKHPHAYGRVRGLANIKGPISWLCLDIDSSVLSIHEVHKILNKLNHHIARTSNPNNDYKFRVILELSKPINVSKEQWKFFIASIGNSLGLKIDSLGRSQCFYGYKGREVYSTIDGHPFDPSSHLNVASMRVAELEEKRANAIPKGIADKALQNPFTTFEYAYLADSGEGTTRMLGAIQHAKELGASPAYIRDLLLAINNFWDKPMNLQRLQSTVMTAI